MSQREVIDKIKNYCLLLNSTGINVEKAFLYGSWARGDAGADSDIDVMIVSSQFDTNDHILKAKAWRMTEKIDLKIEPYTVGLNKFMNDKVSPLIQIVREQGVEITL
jgi:uncharacterized protein